MLRKLNSYYEEISLRNRRFMSQARGRETAPQRRNKSAHVKNSNTFCYTIPTGLAWPEENTNGEMTPYTKPATAKRVKETPFISYHKGKSLIRTTSSPQKLTGPSLILDGSEVV